MASRASLEESQRRLTLGGAGRYIRGRVLEPTFTADTTAVVLPPVPPSHKNRPGGVWWTEVVDKMQPRGWVCGDLKSSEKWKGCAADAEKTCIRLGFGRLGVGTGQDCLSSMHLLKSYLRYRLLCTWQKQKQKKKDSSRRFGCLRYQHASRGLRWSSESAERT